MEEITTTPNAEAAAAASPAPGEPAPLTPAPAPTGLTEEPADPKLAGEPVPPPGKGRSKLFYILAGVFGTIGVIALLCVGLTIISGWFTWQAGAEVHSVLTTYMEALANQEVSTAYAMMSEAGKEAMSREDFEEFVTGYGREYTHGFKALKLQAINRGVYANTDAEALQGEVTTVRARLEYEDGSEGILNATLQKVGSRWMVFGVNIQRSPAPEQIEKPTTG